MLSRVRVLRVSPLSNITPISFFEFRLELRDENLEDEELQMDEACLNSSPKEEVVKEKKIYILTGQMRKRMGV